MKVTCVYNTTTRKKKTAFGQSLTDEMCFLYAMVSPPVHNLGHCWHIDNGINVYGERVKRSRKQPCRAECGRQGLSEFSLPRGSGLWPSHVPEGRGGESGEREIARDRLRSLERANLGDGLAGASVCED